MRSRGSTRSPAANGTDASSPPRMASANACCSSRSDGMATVENRLRRRGFGKQRIERRYRRVPLDQRGPRTETIDRAAIQCPHLGRDRCAVSIDETMLTDLESGEVNFGDGRCRDRVEVQVRIEAMVDGVDVDVVDVE